MSSEERFHGHPVVMFVGEINENRLYKLIQSDWEVKNRLRRYGIDSRYEGIYNYLFLKLDENQRKVEAVYGCEGIPYLEKTIYLLVADREIFWDNLVEEFPPKEHDTIYSLSGIELGKPWYVGDKFSTDSQAKDAWAWHIELEVCSELQDKMVEAGLDPDEFLVVDIEWSNQQEHWRVMRPLTWLGEEDGYVRPE